MGAAHVDIYRRVDPVQHTKEDRSDPACVYFGQTPGFLTGTDEAQWQIWRITYVSGVIDTTFANHAKYNAIWDNRSMYFDPCPPGGSPVPGIVDTNVVLTPTISLLPMPVRDTEYSYTFPNDTKRFTLKNRGNGLIKLGFATGVPASTTYLSIEPGTSYTEKELGMVSLTLYFESPSNNQNLEILSWT